MGKHTVIGACPHDCPDTCSMLTTIEDGVALSVRGNPDHPFTRGRLCVKVNNYQQRVYDPNRVLYPMRRSGPKGSGEFEQISWDDALVEIGERWRAIIAEHGPQAILPYSYLGTQGILNGMNVGDPFFNKIGASVAERTFCESGSSTGYKMTVGASEGTDPESFAHSKYIILWACNTLSTNSHHWPFIEAAKKNGAKVVVIDPMRTKTARLATWHVRIRPGTDGALALGLMNVIIAEDLVDRDYVEKHTIGFEELAERASNYTPGSVSEITGLPAEDIRTLAREYAKSEPAVIRIGVAIERHAGGGQAVRAICCLPALIGSWRHVGGGLLQMPIHACPVNWDDLTRADLIEGNPQVVNLLQIGSVLAGEQELAAPIKSMFVYNANPMVMVADQEKMAQGLKRDDLFTVVSEHFMTDTAKYADILLPATTQLEQIDIMFSWGQFYLAYNNQAVEPLGEAVSNTELFRRVAKVMGINDSFFYRSDEQMVVDAIAWDDPLMDGVTLEQMKETGFMRLAVGSPDTHAPHRDGNFPTPSGKCEFRSSLAEEGNFVSTLYRQGYGGQQSGEPVDPLPHYTPPNESVSSTPDLAKSYPLSLVSPKSHSFLNSQYWNFPTQLAHAGGHQVLMNPKDASERSVETGQTVNVFNARGHFDAIVSVTDDVMEGVVIAPVGFWSKAGGATVHSVTSTILSDLGRAPTYSDCLVEVKAAGTRPGQD